MTALDVPAAHGASGVHRRAPIPYGACALIGLGGLFAGVTGPLLSAFIPPLVRDALGEQRTAIGAIMAIDNVLLLLLVPWAGPASDRASASGRGRLPLVMAGFLLASLGMAVLPLVAATGLVFLVGAMVLLHTGINLQRSPFQALVAENLFDTSGFPELGFDERPFRPAFTDLKIAPGAPITGLPGAVAYAGSAYPSDCSHCRTWRAAVVEQGRERLTLREPDDVGYLARWLDREVLADTARLRALVLSALGATGLLGERPVLIRRRADVPDAGSPFLRGVDNATSEWQTPPTTAWQSSGATRLAFGLFVRGAGVFAVRAEWSGQDRLNVFVSPVAAYMH